MEEEEMVVWLLAAMDICIGLIHGAFYHNIQGVY